MRLQRSNLATITALVVLVFVAGLVPAVADGDKAQPQATDAKKAKQADAKEAPAPPVSPIYDAARRASEQKRQADDAGATVITNDDLERMMAGLTPEQKLQGVYQAERHIGVPAPAGDAPAAGAAPAPEQAAGQAPQSSLEWMEQQEAAAREGRAGQVDARKEVEDLSARVVELERRLLALKNPLLPRRYSDRKDDEAEDWDQKDNLQRIETTQKELDEARVQLQAAQARLGRGR